MLCHNLAVQRGIRGERDGQEGVDVCILVADSCCCMVEANTIL